MADSLGMDRQEGIDQGLECHGNILQTVALNDDCWCSHQRRRNGSYFVILLKEAQHFLNFFQSFGSLATRGHLALPLYLFLFSLLMTLPNIKTLSRYFSQEMSC